MSAFGGKADTPFLQRKCLLLTQSGHCRPDLIGLKTGLVRNLTAEGYVRRRDFIKIIAGSAVSWPLAVQAQQPDRMRHVSVLLGISETDPETKYRIRAFRLGMRDAGWIEGRNNDAGCTRTAIAP